MSGRARWSCSVINTKMNKNVVEKSTLEANKGKVLHRRVLTRNIRNSRNTNELNYLRNFHGFTGVWWFSLYRSFLGAFLRTNICIIFHTHTLNYSRCRNHRPVIQCMASKIPEKIFKIYVEGEENPLVPL